MRRKWIAVVWLLVMVITSGAWAGVSKADEAPVEPPVKIHLKHTEPRTVATMMHKGSFEHVPRVIGKLMADITEGGHLVAGPVMIVYVNDPNEAPEEEYLWEVWVPVARPGVFGKAENDEMGFKYLDIMFVAYMYHIGPYETVGESYNLLFEWAQRNKYNMIGPPVEVYWSDAAQSPQEDLVTEIWLPVAEKTIPGGIVE
jgi:effector-binding domain-containing protein